MEHEEGRSLRRGWRAAKAGPGGGGKQERERAGGRGRATVCTCVLVRVCMGRGEGVCTHDSTHAQHALARTTARMHDSTHTSMHDKKAHNSTHARTHESTHARKHARQHARTTARTHESTHALHCPAKFPHCHAQEQYRSTRVTRARVNGVHSTRTGGVMTGGRPALLDRFAVAVFAPGSTSVFAPGSTTTTEGLPAPIKRQLKQAVRTASQHVGVGRFGAQTDKPGDAPPGDGPKE